MHGRKQIREYVKELLTGLPTTGDRVEIGRTRPLATNFQPTLLIYTVEESSNREFDGNPAALGRTLQLVVDGRVSDPSVPDDILDQIALEVEDRMRTKPKFEGLIFDQYLTGTTLEVRAEGTSHLGVVRMEFRIRYSDPEEDE